MSLPFPFSNILLRNELLSCRGQTQLISQAITIDKIETPLYGVFGMRKT